MKDKATSFDIAHMAGVSQSTVSRALSNSPLVNKETRERVQRIAREMNYKVDKNASNLRKQRSSTIALLLFEDPSPDDSLINPFFMSMLGSITRACATFNYDLLVSFQNMNGDWHAEYEDSHKSDGLILLGYGDYLDYRDKLTQLQDQGTHFVRWGAHDTEYPGISIGCDNYQGGQIITEHLIQQGAKSFAFIGTAGQRAPEFMARFQGHIDMLATHNLLPQEAIQYNAVSTEEAGFDATQKLLASGARPNALVCASDLIAVGAIKCLKTHGIGVPRDMLVSGYDNIPISGFTTPTLSTVQQNTKKAGELLVSNLLKLIKGESVADYLMPAELVIRESTQRAD
ncbi:LacI family DNA-binding transcriptional regulator [Alteromonas oceanisediminis]|uniref:LacI family DNA-binding transcriptional regulator n=1 Tax=Alteromonas oceanisediminis TaxID=2836180 RepID=UPI001BDAD364|nr:LacI family DNA-binding transcriptional regulator [Alteromonas oceanisediminis]MBT0586451.1 LacI family DNA-binding transcriptional regulator [Alteromonas oceanisediminis]